MGFMVRFILGTTLVLLCSWSVGTANPPVHQVSNNGDKSTEKLKKIETETTTQQNKIIANLKEDNKPKTDNSTENKQNSIVDKLEVNKTEPKREEIGRSIDITKYVSKDFHSKNNVYTLPTSPENEKFVNQNQDYNFHHASTNRHEEFYFDSELTTPKSSIFDHRYKEAVESVDQKLEHIDNSHEISSESESESKETINLEKLFEETKKNDTEADLNYINYKNIISNDTGGKNSLHKDLVVEAGTNLAFRSSYNHTTVIDDENDNENNTIVKEPVETSTLSNAIPIKGDLDSSESSTTKSVILTTRKSIFLTKPPSNKSNSSHISILSNNIETETVKAVHFTEKLKGEKEVEPEVSETKEIPIDISKRVSFENSPEQQVQENQVIPIHVEAPSNRKKPTTTEHAVRTSVVETTVTNSTESVIEKIPLPEIVTTSEPKITTSERVTTVLPTTSSERVKITTTERVTAVPPTTSTERVKIPTTERVTTVPPTTSSERVTTILPTTSTERVTTIIPTTSTEKVTTILPTTSTERVATVLPMNSDETASTIPPTIPAETVGTILPVISNQTIPPTTSAETVATISNQEVSTFPPTTSTEREVIATNMPETKTLTSLLTETSATPWEKVTTETRFESETTTTKPEISTITISSTETTTTRSEISTTTLSPITESESTIFSTYLADSTPSTTETDVTTTELNEVSAEHIITTEDTVRTSKGIVFQDTAVTVPPVTTTTEEVTTTELSTLVTITELPTTEAPKVTTDAITEIVLKIETKNFDQTDSAVEVENTTDNNTSTSHFFEHPDEDNSGTIAAITISSIGAVCLILLAGLLVIMKKRQKRFNYGQRCTPVSLDDYSMDNVSVYNSVRRKAMMRGSKRSYGNPAFEDPVSVSHPLNFPALGKFANNLEDIKAEFEDIPQITARTNELPEGCDTKNRYANVIPLPETRVFLTLIDGYPNSDYINANYVTGPKNTKGYYIACQAPMQNTVDDFWRMIWQQQTKVILMLTHLFENGVEKCVDYLPPSEVLDCHRLFGDFQVTLKKREVKDKYIISSLQFKNMVSNSWREVTHFWYLGWPEKGVPSEANSLIAFLIEARSYMKSSSLDRKDVTINGNLTNGLAKNDVNPVVVHCSPGTGRAGVVIACDIAIREFEQTRLVDVPRIVYRIRRDRASAVQTKDQYAFIYKVISLYATKLTGGTV